MAEEKEKSFWSPETKSAAITGGATALAGYLQALKAEEDERKRRMQEAMQMQMHNQGQQAQNQQQMLAQMIANYKTALVGG